MLINNGFNYEIPEKECGPLRAHGYDVAILRGGLNAWLEQGLSVSGDLTAGPDAPELISTIRGVTLFFADMVTGPGIDQELLSLISSHP